MTLCVILHSVHCDEGREIMATGIVPVATSATDANHLDTEHRSTVEINGLTPQRTVNATEAASQQNGNGVQVEKSPGSGTTKAEKMPTTTTTTNGTNLSRCDSNNKIVIKPRRSIVNDLNPVQSQRTGGNELVVVSNDVEDIQRLYETKPEAFRQWLVQRAPGDLLTRLRKSDTSVKQQETVSSDLFQRWIAFSPTKVSN